MAKCSHREHMYEWLFLCKTVAKRLFTEVFTVIISDELLGNFYFPLTTFLNVGFLIFFYSEDHFLLGGLEGA